MAENSRPPRAMVAARGQKGQRPLPPLSPARNPLPRVMFHRYNAFMPEGARAVPAESLLCIIQWHGGGGGRGAEATQGTPNSSIMSSEPQMQQRRRRPRTRKLNADRTSQPASQQEGGREAELGNQWPAAPPIVNYSEARRARAPMSGEQQDNSAMSADQIYMGNKLSCIECMHSWSSDLTNATASLSLSQNLTPINV